MYGAAVTASARSLSKRARAYAAAVFGTSPRFASRITGMSSGMDSSVKASTSMAAGLVLAACNVTGTTSATNAPKASGPRVGSFDRPISLAFTPSQQAATIATNGAAIKSALERSTGLAWKVTTMTSYAAQVEAMCSGSVDVGFFAPLQMTLLLSKACGTPVIGALRKDDTGALSTTYKSQILVKADSGINDISGLKGKKFAFVDPLSASGFVYPTLAIKNKTGQEPKTFFLSTIFAGGH